MKLWLPISFIILVSVLALGVARMGKPTLTPAPDKLITSPPEKEIVNAYLTLQPEVNTVRVGDDARFSVMVNTGALRTFGVEGHFEYDPQVLTVTSFAPGEFFTEPEILLNTNDPTLGKASFAVGSRASRGGSGIAFIITAKVNQQASYKTSLLKFDQQKSQVSLEAEDQSKRYAEEETVVVFDEKPFSILPR